MTDTSDEAECEHGYVGGVSCVNCKIAALSRQLAEAQADAKSRADFRDMRERDWQQKLAEAQAEIGRQKEILNTPIVEPFLQGAVAEAKHQRFRWGDEHDATKTAWDWFWTLGFLGSKAAHAALAEDWGKAKHHTVTAAAMLANWHRHICEAAALNPTPPREEDEQVIDREVSNFNRLSQRFREDHADLVAALPTHKVCPDCSTLYRPGERHCCAG